MIVYDFIVVRLYFVYYVCGIYWVYFVFNDIVWGDCLVVEGWVNWCDIRDFYIEFEVIVVCDGLFEGFVLLGVFVD